MKEEARKAEQLAADSDDDCSAPKCKRPTGKQVEYWTKLYLSSKYFIFECEQVHWVQCDKCELWYHLFCIGLKPQDIKEDEDFNCKFCKVGSGSKRNNDTSASDMDTE